jgi:hypothetical protein
MKRNRLGRKAVFILLLGVGPLSIGCEAILDFDRTPLQPPVDATVMESAIPGTDSGAKDGSSAGEDGGDKKDAGKDSGSEPKDAGKDSGDAGDSGEDDT